MTTLVISPHLDDAVFSLGRMIAGRSTPVTVLTVHGGGDGERGSEDHRAMNVLGASSEAWAFAPEDPIPNLATMFGRIRRPDQVLIPAGIYHPDHLAVSEAARSVDWGAAQVGVYEEIPYRVWWPDEAYERRRWWGIPTGAQPETQAGPLHAKVAAAECYRSQLSDDIREVLAVPERVWWL